MTVCYTPIHDSNSSPFTPFHSEGNLSFQSKPCNQQWRKLNFKGKTIPAIVRSLLFGLPRYVLIFQSLNKTESLLVPIL